MNLTIIPRKLSGVVIPPPSKSQAHRLAIAAALSDGISRIEHVELSQDLQATLRCIEALGGTWERDGTAVRVGGIQRRKPDGTLPLLDCGESGSTLRFLIPVALALRGGGRFTGRGRLMERPQGPYFDLFREKDIRLEQHGGVLTVRGTLEAGEYRLPGNISSQFFTGLLFALSLVEGDSEIISTTPLESQGYVHMTRHAMAAFGVRAGCSYRELPEGKCQVFQVSGVQRYQPTEAVVETDWSQAAFWYAAAGLGSDVAVEGMNMKSLQMDRMILEWGRMIQNQPLCGGVRVPVLGMGGESACPVPEREQPSRYAVGLDVSRTPDLVPPAAVWGALTPGCDLYLRNAGRLRLKESDRLAAINQTLTAMGAFVTEEADQLMIRGQESLRGGCIVDCCNDHRIAMMAAVAATCCQGPVTLLGAECVAKSYPGFWEEYRRLGGIIQ